MIVAHNIEVPTWTPGITRAANAGLTSDQQPHDFSESLFAASKSSSEATFAIDAGRKSAQRQKVSSDVVKMPVLAPESHVVPSRPHSRETARPQQNLPAHLAPTTAPIVMTPVEPALGWSVGLPADSIMADGKPLRDVAAKELPGGQSQEIKAPAPLVSESGPGVSSILAGNFTDAAPDVPANGMRETDGKAFDDAVSGALPNSIHNAVSNLFQSQIPNVTLNTSGNGDAAPTLHSVSTDRSSPTSQVPDPSVLATNSGVLGAIAGQLVALIGAGETSHLTGVSGVSSSSLASTAVQSTIGAVAGKNESKGANTDALGLKQHALPASNQPESKTGSQDATSSGGQSQSDASSQGQNAASVPMDFSGHAVAAGAHDQSATVTSPSQIVSTLGGDPGQALKTPSGAVLTPIATPQTAPLINSAKLIQSMGQSEMRVGVRSNEFGNISISTSATRELISAQISVDHGELAKALAAHLPEMQARLASTQAVNVRIDINGQGTGQGTGTSGGASNGSTDEWRGRQQAGGQASSHSGNGSAERNLSGATAVMTTYDGGVNSRLDIRV